MRTLRLVFVLMAAVAILPAQTTMASLSAGPATKVLAIGRLTPSATPEKARPVMPLEVRETVKLYLAGKLEQWFSRKDQRGVVFILNVATVGEAHEMLEKLPLGVQKLMEFELIPLGPLTPLNFLLDEPKN